jgi:hypothetical protein
MTTSTPIPQPRPSSPWGNPPQLPPRPCYTPTGDQMTAARLRLLPYGGDGDRQANIALGRMQGALTGIASHLEIHDDCTPVCPALESLIRQARAVSLAFDEACGAGVTR